MAASTLDAPEGRVIHHGGTEGTEVVLFFTSTFALTYRRSFPLVVNVCIRGQRLAMRCGKRSFHGVVN